MVVFISISTNKISCAKLCSQELDGFHENQIKEEREKDYIPVLVFGARKTSLDSGMCAPIVGSAWGREKSEQQKPWNVLSAGYRWNEGARWRDQKRSSPGPLLTVSSGLLQNLGGYARGRKQGIPQLHGPGYVPQCTGAGLQQLMRDDSYIFRNLTHQLFNTVAIKN